MPVMPPVFECLDCHWKCWTPAGNSLATQHHHGRCGHRRFVDGIHPHVYTGDLCRTESPTESQAHQGFIDFLLTVIADLHEGKVATTIEIRQSVYHELMTLYRSRG
jgi:hypothetical protein